VEGTFSADPRTPCSIWADRFKVGNVTACEGDIPSRPAGNSPKITTTTIRAGHGGSRSPRPGDRAGWQPAPSRGRASRRHPPGALCAWRVSAPGTAWSCGPRRRECCDCTGWQRGGVVCFRTYQTGCNKGLRLPRSGPPDIDAFAEGTARSTSW